MVSSSFWSLIRMTLIGAWVHLLQGKARAMNRYPGRICLRSRCFPPTLTFSLLGRLRGSIRSVTRRNQGFIWTKVLRSTSTAYHRFWWCIPFNAILSMYISVVYLCAFAFEPLTDCGTANVSFLRLSMNPTNWHRFCSKITVSFRKIVIIINDEVWDTDHSHLEKSGVVTGHGRFNQLTK